MSDWRLKLNGHMVEKLVGATFYKVTFPEFWEVAYREKNDFYKKIERYAKSYVESTNKGCRTLHLTFYKGFQRENADGWKKHHRRGTC